MVTTPTLMGQEVTVSNDMNVFGFNVTGLQNNNFAVTWSDTNGDIHGRRFDSLGLANSSDFLSNLSGASSKGMRLPELVQQKDGSMRVYYDREGGQGEGDVYVNFVDFDTDGGSNKGEVVLGSAKDEFMIDAAASEYGNAPDTAAIYLVPNAATGTADLYLAHLTGRGLPIGTPVRVPTKPGEPVAAAQVVGLPNGNTLVAYDARKIDPVTGKVETFVRYHVYDDYLDLTGGVDAATTPGNDTFPAVAALERSSDGFVIATQDALGIRFLYHGFGREFHGTVPGTEGSGGGAFTKAIVPKVTALKDQGFIIAWTDTSEREGDNTPAQKIGLQRFDKDGNPVGGNLFINHPGDQVLDTIATLADGRVILTFTDETGDASNVFTHDYQIIDPRDARILGTNNADDIVGRDDGGQVLGFAGEDALFGGAGADRIDGGAGVDTMTGGKGNDVYVVDTRDDRVIEKNGEGTDTVLSEASVSLAGQAIENLMLTGTGNLDGIGNALANAIVGNDGRNVLAGGLGKDVMRGDSGRDTFVFDTKLGTGNIDHIRDFSHVDDTIRLENAIFKGLSTGTLKASAFKDLGVAGAKVDADDHILYNHKTGVLSYDADGSGAGKAVQFAVLDNHPSLTFQDFSIV